MDQPQPVMTGPEIEAYIEEVFPQAAPLYRVAEIAPMRAVVTQAIQVQHLRPGGTVSGPTLFGIADCAFYYACLAMKGRIPLMVTTNLTITFMRRPAAADIRAEARILKLGKTLINGDVLIYSQGKPDPVAHCAVTYAVPPG